jgi:hypothetical protein
MKNLFDELCYYEILKRLEELPPNAQRQWGKMDVAQMLAHCAETMEVAIGTKTLPQTDIGRILGPFLKQTFINYKDFRKNNPADKRFVIVGQCDFYREKVRLRGLIRTFHEGGEKNCTHHPHFFFGKLSPMEWSIGMYKHLDHHLRQFGQ